jgi:hypothetical protein
MCTPTRAMLTTSQISMCVVGEQRRTSQPAPSLSLKIRSQCCQYANHQPLNGSSVVEGLPVRRPALIDLARQHCMWMLQ